ncbi:hypothetical protein RND81_04G047600 [Saponaria officinalis]|uniref:Fe2OG dioxygenase domain-containing protein n=1 Tax=Saponaria officinalis TaxID=3572 RepID=A0AAW1LD13_SAPOF
MDPAIVDLQKLLDSEEELQKLKSLLSSWGAIQLVNHGIKNSTLDQLLHVTKEFFHLPLEEKQKYARSRIEEWKFDQMQGWGNDRMSEGQPFSWNDRLLLLAHPIGLRKSNLWPDESIPKFSEIVDDYVDGLIRIRDIMFKSISRMLNLSDDNLICKYADEGFIVSKFTYYPTSPYPDRILGAGAHTDTTMFSVILQDKEVEALQIEKDGQWYLVPIVPHALVLNISDMLEIMTNGGVKSACHRVVTNAERERISVVAAFSPPANAKIGPLKELIDEKNPKLYPILKNSSQVSADYFAHGKIFIKEIRKYGPEIMHQDMKQSNN